MNAFGKTFLARSLFLSAVLGTSGISVANAQPGGAPLPGQPGGPIAGQPGGPLPGQPGGPIAGQPGGPIARPTAVSPVPVLTPEELEVLAEVEQDLVRYEQAAGQHHRRMRTILASEYTDRKGQLEARYTEKISGAEKLELARRLRAIELLEKFIADYPDHQKFTPDAMFRLADLYLEQAEYDFQVSFDEEVDFDVGDDDDDDLLAAADYSKSIGMWDTIVRKFPKYRKKANTLYLLAYYLKQTEQERKALQIFRGLVCANKYNPLDVPEPAPDLAIARAALGDSNRVAPTDKYEGCVALSDNKELLHDAWVRGIGDIHFLTAGELSEAISSYQKVATDDQSKFYDEALYKLAWSYYRNDDFLLSIEAFDKSVVYSDAIVKDGGDALELREEAVQYIAISFTDPWSIEEEPDPSRSYDRAFDFYKDRFDEPHVRDVFIQLGDTFSVLEAYTQASDSWRLALSKWPLNPDNPEIHQNIVNAFEEMGDSDLANEEAGRLAALYAPGSTWYIANETNREAMESQARIGQRMLRAAAENTHKSAQNARQDWVDDPTEENKANYIDLYLKAGALYERFLKENPTAEASYEFTYRLGEVLFYAEHYQEAIPHYVWVRDHRDLSEKRFEKAARSIVQTYQKELEKQLASNAIVEPSIPTIEELLAMPKPVTAKPLPQAYVDLQNALDKYQTMVNDPQTAPNMGYEAALISFRHLNLPDAELRFKGTLDRFCGSSQSVKSKDALLAIYEAQGNDEKFKETNENFINSKCGSDDDVALAQAQNRSKEFREAASLFKDQKYAEAAIAFYVFYKTAPKDDPNRPIALYNGAIAYDKSGKPKTAVYLLKEFTENKAPAFRDSEYFLPALYFTAVAYYRAFDYENAVSVYLQVAKAASDNKRKPPAGERSAQEMRLDALFNAANIRELDRVYKDPRSAPGTGAASLFQKYAALETDSRKADRALFAVARVWKGAKNLRLQEQAYAKWRSKYGNLAINANDYVFSYYDLAKQYQKVGNKRATAKAKKATLSAWIKVGSPKNTIASDLAAEFAFEEADAFYNRTFTPFKIKRAPKTEKEAKKVIINGLNKLADASVKKFTDLSRFESGPWGLATLVRIGDVRFFQGLKLAEIPTPKEIIKLDDQYPDKDILITYEDTINGIVAPLEEQAKKQWEKVTAAARVQGISDEWTQLAQERLHDFVSQDEFPVQRTELAEGTETP